MVSRLFNHPSVPILAFQLVFQALLWQVGLSLFEAAGLVAAVSVLLPLVSRRARAEYRPAFRFSLSARV